MNVGSVLPNDNWSLIGLQYLSGSDGVVKMTTYVLGPSLTLFHAFQDKLEENNSRTQISEIIYYIIYLNV